jgi:hypothetical protein
LPQRSSNFVRPLHRLLLLLLDVLVMQPLPLLLEVVVHALCRAVPLCQSVLHSCARSCCCGGCFCDGCLCCCLGSGGSCGG